MGSEWSLQWLLLLVLVVAGTEDVPRQKPQGRYMPHGIHLPTAPYPARRNLPPSKHSHATARHPLPVPPGGFSLPAEMATAEPLQLFGDPLPGDNLTLPTQFPKKIYPFGTGPMSEQAGAGGFSPYPMPDGHDLLGLYEPLVRQHVLGPPPPSIDLSQLAQIPGLPPPGPFDLYRLSQTGPNSRVQVTLGSDQAVYDRLPLGSFDLSQFARREGPFRPQQSPGLNRPRNPWYALLVPTAMGPYHRRLKPKPMGASAERQTPLSPLRDIEDPKKSATKILKLTPDADREGPGEAEQLAPLAPPRMAASNTSYLRQGGNLVVNQENSIENMLSHAPRAHKRSDNKGPEPSTRWQYKYVAGSLEAASSRPPPALLSREDGLMEELPPESNDASLYSDAANPVKRRPSSTAFDYILL